MQRKDWEKSKIRYLSIVSIAALLILVLASVAGYRIFDRNTKKTAGGKQEQAAEIHLESKEDFSEQEQEDYEEAVTLKSVPDYCGSPYVELYGNRPCFDSDEREKAEAFEWYSELDSLGRCGQAFANICQELMPDGERENIGPIRPSGWHTVKYNGLIEGNYLYNRCHLIGYQLAGENANERNLITGTRYLNTIGMLPFEDKVAAYVIASGNHVLYRVTPVFEDHNLVASGVELEAWSVEDMGEGVCFHVYCYNVQPGIEIDYATGESWIAGDEMDQQDPSDSFAETENRTDKESPDSKVLSEEEVRKFILNTNTKRIHLPNCASVDDMANRNKQEYTGSIHELKEEGYIPCGRCLTEYR